MAQVLLFTDNEIPVNKTLKQLRNEHVRNEFDEQTKKKHLDAGYVVKQLSKKYFIEETTVWLIVLQQGAYKDK